MCSLSTCVMNYHSCLLYQIVLLHCIVNVMSAKQHWEEQLAEIFFQLTIKDLDKWIKLSDQQKDMTVSEQLNLLFDMTMQLYDDCEVWIFLAVGILGWRGDLVVGRRTGDLRVAGSSLEARP